MVEMEQKNKMMTMMMMMMMMRSMMSLVAMVPMTKMTMSLSKMCLILAYADRTTSSPPCPFTSAMKRKSQLNLAARPWSE